MRECEEVVRRKAPSSLSDLALLLNAAHVEMTPEASPKALEQALQWISDPPPGRGVGGQGRLAGDSRCAPLPDPPARCASFTGGHSRRPAGMASSASYPAGRMSVGSRKSRDAEFFTPAAVPPNPRGGSGGSDRSSRQGSFPKDDFQMKPQQLLSPHATARERGRGSAQVPSPLTRRSLRWNHHPASRRKTSEAISSPTSQSTRRERTASPP